MSLSSLVRLLLPALLAALFLPSWAMAEEGILEINQTCAVETGYFEGDTAGFPVTIRSNAGSHSFALTSDLAVTSSQTTAIEISRTNVRVDLRGFEIACRTPPFNIPCTQYSVGAAFEGGTVGPGNFCGGLSGNFGC